MREMFTAGITYYNLPKEGLTLSLDDPTGGYDDEKTLKRIAGVTSQMLTDFQGRTKAGWIRSLVKAEKSKSTEQLPLQDGIDAMKAEAKKSEALAKFRTQKRDVYDQIRDTPPLLDWKDEFGNTNSDKALHRVMIEAYKEYGLDEGLLWSDKAIGDLSAEEICKITSQYYLIARDFDVPLANWVRTLLEECEKAHPELFEDAETTGAEPSEPRPDTTIITAEETVQMESEYPAIGDFDKPEDAEAPVATPADALEVVEESDDNPTIKLESDVDAFNIKEPAGIWVRLYLHTPSTINLLPRTEVPQCLDADEFQAIVDSLAENLHEELKQLGIEMDFE